MRTSDEGSRLYGRECSCFSIGKVTWRFPTEQISIEHSAYTFFIMKENNHSIHIGQCIKERLAAEGKSTVWLAKQLGCHRTNLYKIYDKATIDTGILLRISKIMRFNFFLLYDDLLNETKL